ncbi:mobilization protein, partial [Serratia marcescens]
RLMAAMDAYLERDHDRALFGLPPRQKDEPG